MPALCSPRCVRQAGRGRSQPLERSWNSGCTSLGPQHWRERKREEGRGGGGEGERRRGVRGEREGGRERGGERGEKEGGGEGEGRREMGVSCEEGG